MVLKLYGYTTSTCTRQAALICKEKQVPYEFVSVDLIKGEQKAPAYVKHQPFGQVPYIDDDGFILYESRAISRYLIKKYPDQGTLDLIPTDPKEEALFEQAASVEVFHFNSHASAILLEKLVKPLYGDKTDQAKVDEELKAIETKLDVYEAILGKQKYLAGDKATLADLQHLPHGSELLNVGFGHLFKKRPSVTRWWNDISSRPAWQAVKDGAQPKQV